MLVRPIFVRFLFIHSLWGSYYLQNKRIHVTHVLFKLQLVFATVVVDSRMTQRPLLSPPQRSYYEGGDWLTNAGTMGVTRDSDMLKAFQAFRQKGEPMFEGD